MHNAKRSFKNKIPKNNRNLYNRFVHINTNYIIDPIYYGLSIFLHENLFLRAIKP